MSDLSVLIEADQQPTKPVLPGYVDVDTVILNYRERLIEGAKRYAASDRSDPFTLDRCMAHIRQGLCKAVDPFRQEKDENGNKIDVKTGLPWFWREPVFKEVERRGKKVMVETGRYSNHRTEIIGNAGAPGHYDAEAYTVMRMSERIGEGENYPVTEYKNVRRP